LSLLAGLLQTAVIGALIKAAGVGGAAPAAATPPVAV